MKLEFDEQRKLLELVTHDLELAKLHVNESDHDEDSKEHKDFYRKEVKLLKKLIQKILDIK